MKFLDFIMEKKMEAIQHCCLFFVFLIFFLNVFLTLPTFVFYLLIIFVIANVIFGFINKKKRIFFNLILLFLALLQFIFLFGYFATIVGSVLTLVYLIIDCVAFFKK